MTSDEIKKAWIDGTELMVEHPDLGMGIISPNTYELLDLCWNPHSECLRITNSENCQSTRIGLDKVFPAASAWSEYTKDASLKNRGEWLIRWENELKQLRKAP